MTSRSDVSEQAATSVGFISLGCAKNRVDSQIMAGRLVGANIQLTQPEDADIIIVNTCSFIHDAREESMEMILSACEQKKRGNCRAVLVAGCLPQRYKEQIKETLPDVDAFIGLDELDDIPQIIRQLQTGQSGILSISDKAHKLFDPDIPVVFSTGSNAYLKIAEGCNHRCAFCAIPGIRGNHRSRSIEAITKEAHSLINQGFRELDIISQDITYYGYDLTPKNTLAELLQEVAKIDGDYWVRLLYGYPGEITDELLEVIAESPHICNYLDIPIQHSHPDILKAMLRGSTINPLQKMVKRIREAIPDCTIRTTCLVGFPGETEEHFQHLLDFCREARFNHLGAFTYSPEENTPAFDMPDTVPPELARERYQRLMQQQQQITAEINAKKLGQTTTILLEEINPDGIGIGRTAGQAPEVDGFTAIDNLPKDITSSTFIQAAIDDFEGYDLSATYTPPSTSA